MITAKGMDQAWRLVESGTYRTEREAIKDIKENELVVSILLFDAEGIHYKSIEANYNEETEESSWIVMPNPIIHQRSPNFLIVQRIIDEHQQLFANLAERWQNESKYEDINDYKKTIEKALAAQTYLVITSMTKRPFGFKFTLNNKKYIIQVKLQGNKAIIHHNEE